MRRGMFLCLFILCCIYLTGCGTTKFQSPIMQKPPVEGRLDRAIEEMADSLRGKLFTSNEIYEITLVDAFKEGGGATYLEEHITLTLRGILGTKIVDGGPRIKLLDRDLIRENMSVFGLKVNASDIYQNADKWDNMGFKIPVIVYWTDANEESIKITLEVFDIKKHGQRIYSIFRGVPKDDQIRKLMGEKLPGTLFIKSPDHDARVFCDSEDKGQVGKNGLLIDVPYGNHFIQVEKEGYKPFAKSIWMHEGGSERLAIKFTSPSDAQLSAFLVNAVVPMSATFIYGPRMGTKRSSIAFNKISAGLFYVSGSLFLIDYFGGHRSKGDYLTEGNYDTYKNIKDIELYCTLGFYALNLISGIAVGADYQINNRKGIEIIHGDGGYKPNFGHYGARSSYNLLSIKFSF
jgi:hypothetical protein